MSSERPNILLILADTARQDVYGAYGGPCRTPHLDRLASEGVRFERAFCVSPICHPARASIATGLFSHAHGMMANRCGEGAYPYRVFDHVRSCAQLLSQRGYRCGYAGQGHIDLTGFDDDRSIPTARYYAWLEEQGFQEGALPERQFDACGQTPYDIELARDTQFADTALTLLREYANGSQPWLIQCDFDGPHPPCYVPPPYDTLYDPAEVELPPNLRDPLTDKPPTHLNNRIAQGCANWTDEQWQVLISHYYGMVTMLTNLSVGC